MKSKVLSKINISGKVAKAIALGLSLVLLNHHVVSLAKMQESYQEGSNYQGRGIIRDPSVLGDKAIFDQGADISGLINLGDKGLAEEGAKILSNSEEGKLLEDSDLKVINSIQEHKMTLENPLYKNSLKVEVNPLQVTSGEDYQVQEVVTKVAQEKQCLEGVSFEVDVIRQLILEGSVVDELGSWQQQQMTISEKDLEKSWGNWVEEDITHITGSEGTWIYYTKIREWDHAVQQGLKTFISSRLGASEDRVGGLITVGYSKDEYRRPIISQLNYQYRALEKRFKEQGEYWEIVNKEQEALTEQQECFETKRECLEVGEKIFFGQFTVNRPCWKEKVTYSCTSQPIDGCKYLLDQGCHLKDSTCNKQLGKVCLQWSRIFKCFEEQKEMKSSLKNSEVFCLGGDCHTPKMEQNNDIHLIGHLAMLNEIRKDMKVDPIEVFKGEASSCNKSMVNFLNCCSSMKGWGKDLGLSRCKAEEKALALKKSKGLCRVVGTYCAARDPIFKQCLRKKTVYCCFGSKLARIFQEQGRSQLGLNFGEPKNASCRGFTVEELSQVDFSKFNLEELFSDLINKAKGQVNKNFPTITPNQIPAKQHRDDHDGL